MHNCNKYGFISIGSTVNILEIIEMKIELDYDGWKKNIEVIYNDFRVKRENIEEL